MKTITCDCGETRTTHEEYANTTFVVCIRCGIVITHIDDKTKIQFAKFVYQNDRKNIRAEFAGNKKVLDFALQIKNAQEEEEYKRKKISESQTFTSFGSGGGLEIVWN